MNGFRFATVLRPKLVTMLSSASKMAGVGSPIGLGKPCVRLQNKAALSGILRKQVGHGRRLRSGCRKYGRYSGSTLASRLIRSRLSKAQDTKRVSKSTAALHFTPSKFLPAVIKNVKVCVAS